jgi:hypothetical protein
MLGQTSIPSYVDHHKLALKLKPILVGELHLAKKLIRPAYIFRTGLFIPVINEGATPSKEIINTLIRNSFFEVFVFEDDLLDIKKNLEGALVKITRSLSVGDPIENGTKDIKLLSLNLGGLYRNPHNDELLMLQFQSSQNLSKFLMENKKLHGQFYESLQNENFHFTLSQPMLSSLMLLSFLQSIHLFHDKEVENLFLASYLKDLGIAMIPDSKYDLKVLSDRDKLMFANHADYSFDLLEGRVPLSKNYLTIVKNHHFLNDKLKDIALKKRSSKENDTVIGIETMLVAVFDIIVAMTSDRPFRNSRSMYHTLEIVKKLMSDDYPQEFRALVVFLKQFYRN